MLKFIFNVTQNISSFIIFLNNKSILECFKIHYPNALKFITPFSFQTLMWTNIFILSSYICPKLVTITSCFMQLRLEFTYTFTNCSCYYFLHFNPSFWVRFPPFVYNHEMAGFCLTHSEGQTSYYILQGLASSRVKVTDFQGY